MAKLQMQRVYLCALKKDRKDILETLQRLELVEIRKFEEDVQNKYVDEDMALKKEKIKKNIDNAKESLEILKEISTNKISEPFFLNGRKQLFEKDYNDYYETKYEDDERLANLIVSNNKSIREKRAEIYQLNARLETLEPWENLKVPIDFKGTKSTRFFIGTLPGNLSKLQIEEMIVDKLSKKTDNSKKVEDIPFEVEVISTIDVLTYFTLICLKEDEEMVYESLRLSGFIPPVIEGDITVMQMKTNALENIKMYNQEIDELQKQILAKADKVDNLRFLLDYESLRIDKLDALSKLGQSQKTFILKGYIPKNYSQKLQDILKSKYILELQFEDVNQDDADIPVLLQNNGYSAPVESVIESYSLPCNDDVDPTFTVSIFYYFMFGLMLSDAGYGLIIFLVSLIGLIKFRDTIEDKWRRTLRMYVYCGAFTIFWGIMFGSYFGDMFDIITETFFGNKTTIPPLWYFPVKDPMRLLTFSLIIGIVHLFSGMFLKAVQLSKKKDYSTMFKEVILWYGLLIGCLILLLSTDMIRGIFKYDFILPNSIIMLGKILAIGSSIGIILTNGSSSNIGLKIAQGLYALYGISGYLSDVLSYSRLLALGLATGVIASVINMMGGMVAKSIGGVFGVIVFIIIMVFGHLFNLAINALGAYVHTNRLQYVELFGKFYEGGGEKFNPLRMNTKYYKFKESRNND